MAQSTIALGLSFVASCREAGTGSGLQFKGGLSNPLERRKVPRACGHSSDSDCCSDEVDHRAIACVGFLVARCDFAEFLDLAEEIFDQMAPFVHLEVAIDGVLSIGFWRNGGDGAPAVEFGAQPIVVEGFVGEQGADGDAGDQRFDADAVVSLTWQQDEARQIAERIDKRDDFARQTTARSPDCLILSPPLAPAPCWWTRTIVPSIMAYSKSGSPDNALKKISKTPFTAQRRKRRKINSTAQIQDADSAKSSRCGQSKEPFRESRGYPGRYGLDRQACQEAEAQPAPIAHRSKFVESRLVSSFRALNQNSP